MSRETERAPGPRNTGCGGKLFGQILGSKNGYHRCMKSAKLMPHPSSKYLTRYDMDFNKKPKEIWWVHLIFRRAPSPPKAKGWDLIGSWTFLEQPWLEPKVTSKSP